MADQFLAEIRMFGCNFAPRGWAQCNGQLLSISQNTALFALVGVSYGGDGRVTFGLPNLQGASAIHQGSGAGLSPYTVGENGGVAAVTLLTNEMPAHTHLPNAKTAGNAADPNGLLWAVPGTRPAPNFFANALGTTPLTMNPLAVGVTGGSQPHNNLMPYQVMNFCIALQGIFPQRP